MKTFRSRSEPSTDETPESVLAAKEIGQAVSQALADLPEDLRQAITLRGNGWADRGHCAGDGLPNRHSAVAHFSGRAS